MTAVLERRPVPLRPDPDAMFDRAMTSIARAAIITARRVREPHVKNLWRDDRDAELITRTAVSPTSTSDAAALATIRLAFIAALMPVSAAAQLIARSLQLSFDGAVEIGIPALTMPNAKWIREGAPIPVTQGNLTAGPMIEPYKLAVITSLSNEMIARSNAESMIRQLLIENTGPAIDAVMFSTNAGTPGLQPPGLLDASLRCLHRPPPAMTRWSPTSATSFKAFRLPAVPVSRSLLPHRSRLWRSVWPRVIRSMC